VTRTEFEELRDLENKRIETDIVFSPRRQHPSTLSAEGIKIVNDFGVDAILEIHYNPNSDAKVFSVIVPEAGGPICRLCVDGAEHHPHGRCHKHSLLTPLCPKQNLKTQISDHSALSGRPIQELFDHFCQMAKIQFTGSFSAPV
jgi:hypothetical protein